MHGTQHIPENSTYPRKRNFGSLLKPRQTTGAENDADVEQENPCIAPPCLLRRPAS
jgi:hypothetical protein